MPALKCKMCGGDLVITPGETICECEYCGSKQTIPAADNEKKLTLFARANRLRFNSEFDKAAGIYESIVADFPEEAEAYWGLVLCKYGIEYVDDPATAKKVPTCHRSSFESVLDEQNFDMACEYAEPEAKRLYREEAKAIETIRKGIIEVSGKEEPYDIFICYKETADDGNRTLDSVLAQDIYTALTEKGYRVFFSRITLEDKLGQEYEPYIFAALHSARVMLAVGTQFEYYDAVWVKNEWSRYLKLIEAGEKKTLIPCFKNLDPYDMPKEFAKLQAQDLGKVGATQDLLRGIEKILGSRKKTEPAKETVYVHKDGSVSAEALLKRAFILLGDREWQQADSRFEQVLDADPENGRAYLGKLLVELKLSKPEELQTCDDLFYQRKNYKNCLRFAEKTLAEQIRRYGKEREEREQKRLIDEKSKECEIQDTKVTKQKTSIGKLNDDIQNLVYERDNSLQALSNKKKTALGLIAFGAAIFFIAGLAKATGWCLLGMVLILIGVIRIPKAGKTKELKDGFNDKIHATEQLIVEERAKLAAENQKLAELQRKLQELRSKALDYTEPSTAKSAGKTNKQTANRENQGENLTATALPGEIVKFGRYVHGSGLQPIPIIWRVMERENGKALLVSEYGLINKAYNKEDIAITWENSTLRAWLNESFLSEAFTADERGKIVLTCVRAEKNPTYTTDAGCDTNDKIFLLSISEVERYLTSSERMCVPTVYAVEQGANVSGSSTVDGKKTCWWWLRSPGKDSPRAAYVDNDGSIYQYGNYVNYSSGCVRPAMWVSVGN